MTPLVLALMGLAHAQPSPCALMVLTGPSTDHELGVNLTDDGSFLPRRSMVKRTGTCPNGKAEIKILSVDPWHRVSGTTLAKEGETGCLDAALLRPLGEDLLIAQASAAHSDSSLTPGQELGPYEPGEACALPSDQLRHLRPTPADEKTIMQEIVAGLPDGVPLSALAVSDWGTVALPLAHLYTPEEMATEYEREHLKTEKQKQRAVVARGPLVGEVPLYLHFLGSDAPLSDIWAAPDTIMRALALMTDWASHCPGTLDPENEQNCVVQIGDLAYPSPKQPDPLGHKDHYRGTCMDLRLFRNDGSRYEAWYNRADDRPEFAEATAYNSALTGAFLKRAIEQHGATNVLFNDPEVIATVRGIRSARGHDDHFHMCFDGANQEAARP